MYGIKHVLTLLSVYPVLATTGDPVSISCGRHNDGLTYAKSGYHRYTPASYYVEYPNGFLLNSVSRDYVINIRLWYQRVGTYRSNPSYLQLYDGSSKSSVLLKVISSEGFYSINNTGQYVFLDYQGNATNTMFAFSCSSVAKRLASSAINTGPVVGIVVPVVVIIAIIGGCVLYCRQLKKSSKNNCFQRQHTSGINRQGSIIRLHDHSSPVVNTIMSPANSCVITSHGNGVVPWEGRGSGRIETQENNTDTKTLKTDSQQPSHNPFTQPSSHSSYNPTAPPLDHGTPPFEEPPPSYLSLFN